jgi:hypothetical protein
MMEHYIDSRASLQLTNRTKMLWGKKNIQTKTGLNKTPYYTLSTVVLNTYLDEHGDGGINKREGKKRKDHIQRDRAVGGNVLWEEGRE